MISAANILHALAPFQQVLQELHVQEHSHLEKKGNTTLQKNIKLAYSFITLTLMNDGDVYLKITFELKQDLAVPGEVYVADASRKSLLENSIRNHAALKNFRWSAAADNEYKNDTVITRCLAIADAIAGTVVNCARGDDYLPGCYSSIEISEEKIVLRQINRMNSKSLDHKNDYSLRDLEFTIPLAPVAPRFNDHQIGPMLISFSDHSSANNRACGERIEKQIELEKAAYRD